MCGSADRSGPRGWVWHVPKRRTRALLGQQKSTLLLASTHSSTLPSISSNANSAWLLVMQGLTVFASLCAFALVVATSYTQTAEQHRLSKLLGASPPVSLLVAA